ncbi:MAG: class I SAM-dependent methyltransferase [Cyclobacteriaceae bacterium]
MAEWFTDWFDSPYYHTLYKNRDDNEAQRFIDQLINYLQFTKEDKLLDLACGKGRHSIYLNKKGFDVVGADLAPQSIAAANEFSNERLKFVVHDMREVLAKESFDYVLNLFTSFGYFDDEKENYQTIEAIKETLLPNGRLVIDFMNTDKVVANLVSKEEKTVDGVTFHITREVIKGFITKNIRFTDKGKSYHFTERVKVIPLEDFESYLKGWKIEKTFGNYQLEEYDKTTSDRLIIVARKK